MIWAQVAMLMQLTSNTKIIFSQPHWGMGGLGLWLTWFRDSTVISESVRVLLCNKALGTSPSLAVEGEACKLVFSRFSQCSTLVSTEFAVFVPYTKRFKAMVSKFFVSQAKLSLL